MKRLPILPTLIVAAAAAVMIALGVWQMQRAAWKQALLSELAEAPSLPQLDLDAVLDGRMPRPEALAFRRVTVTCRVRDALPAARAGRSLQGQIGYSYFIPCRPGEDGLAGRIQVNAGWSARPESELRLTTDGPVTGQLGTVESEGPVILTAAEPLGGLAASATPQVAEIPDNHMAYAFQWFFFAATAVIVYLLALRRRRGPVAPPPREP